MLRQWILVIVLWIAAEPESGTTCCVAKSKAAGSKQWPSQQAAVRYCKERMKMIIIITAVKKMKMKLILKMAKAMLCP